MLHIRGMHTTTDIRNAHPGGEGSGPDAPEVTVDTFGGRIHVEWDPQAAVPDRHAEAVTSRPLLLHAVARQTTLAGQTRLSITSMHRDARALEKILGSIHQFLNWPARNAEQLEWRERWRILLSRILIWILKGKLLSKPPKAIASAT